MSSTYKNPPLYDYKTYKLNAWEDDKPLIKKYKDFMKKPVEKLELMQQGFVADEPKKPVIVPKLVIPDKKSKL